MAARTAAAFVCGALFGVGLAVSQMLNPAKVLAFLDVFGEWDPSLAFVLGGAVTVMALALRVIMRRPRPLFDSRFHLPARDAIDGRLVTGATLFGLGWGLVGLCPGPALAGLVLARGELLVFVAAMVAGMLIHDWILKGKA